MRYALLGEYPGYRVTSDGRVQSCWNVAHHTPTAPWRDLAQATGPTGYRKVCLTGGKNAVVHRLVAIAFIPNPDGLPCVRHLDGDPANNAVHNLAWGTHRDNEHDKKRHGKYDVRYTAVAKLTAADRARARELVAAGGSHRQVARAVGVTKSTISRLISGASWTREMGPR